MTDSSRLYDLVADLVQERVDCRAWEFPDPDNERGRCRSPLGSRGRSLACAGPWSTKSRDQPEVTYAEASAFLLNPPPRPAITPPAPRPAAPTAAASPPYSDKPSSPSGVGRPGAISSEGATHAQDSLPLAA